jgi:hypothetical protein
MGGEVRGEREENAADAISSSIQPFCDLKEDEKNFIFFLCSPLFFPEDKDLLSKALTL